MKITDYNCKNCKITTLYQKDFFSYDVSIFLYDNQGLNSAAWVTRVVHIGIHTSDITHYVITTMIIKGKYDLLCQARKTHETNKKYKNLFLSIQVFTMHPILEKSVALKFNPCLPLMATDQDERKFLFEKLRKNN